MGVAVNARTGQVVELPGPVCCWKGAGERTIFKKNSRLLVLAGLINENGQHGAHFYELKNNEFIHIKTIPIKEDELSPPSSTLSPATVAPTDSSPVQIQTPGSLIPSAQPQEHPRPNEEKPPIASNLVFSIAQIHYCLAEDIRLESAKSAVNNYIDSDVDRFNAMVADYNSRCSSFKYQTNNRGRNDLNSSQRDIEPFRSQLQSEGRRKFVRSPSTGSLSAPTYDTEGWTEESTNSTDVGPWLNYDPPGTRYYRDANNVIYRVFPPGVRPNAHAANPFGLGDSTERPQ